MTTAVLVVIVVISLLLLAVIVIAPSRKVRSEPPLDPAAEAKILLRRDPDEPTGEVPRVTAVPEPDGDPGDGDFSKLAELDDEL